MMSRYSFCRQKKYISNGRKDTYLDGRKGTYQVAEKERT